MGRPKKEQPNHGKYYEIKATVHDAYGGKFRKSFYSEISKEDAKQQAKDYEVAHNVAELAGEPLIDKSVSFETWAKKWLETYKKPNVDINTYHLTYEGNVNKHLIPCFGKMPIDNIKPIQVKDFFNANKNLSESVLKKFHMCLNGIFETAIENDLCRKNPAKHIDIKSDREKNIKKTYTDKQITSVKAYSKDRLPEVFLLLNSGIRRGELVGLAWDDFNVKEKCISINRSVADLPHKKGLIESQLPTVKINPPKWNSYRNIPISDECVSFLQNLPKNGKYIFPKVDGNLQSPNTWSQKLKRFMKEMNNENPDIPILSAHELRHTFGTALRRRDVDIYTIQKIMGHKDIKMTTEIYVHNELEPLRKGLKLGTSVVQVSYGRKFKLKRAIKKATQATE
jgi:integrase